MIHLLFAGYVPEVVGEHHKVRGDSLGVEGHPAIAATSARPRIGTGPDVARGGLTAENKSKVLDLDSLVDAGNYPFTPVVQLGQIDVQRKGTGHFDSGILKSVTGNGTERRCLM